MKEIDGRKVACDWSLPREVYQEIKEKEEPHISEDEAEDKEKPEDDQEDDEAEEKMDIDLKAGEDVIEDLSEDDEEDELSEEDEDEEDQEVEEEKEEVKEKGKKKIRPEKRKDPTGADVLEGRSVFLRNIPFDADEETIETMCESHGYVLYIFIAKNL